MFTRRLLAGLALAAVTANASECYPVESSDNTYKLTYLKSDVNYNRGNNSLDGTLTWNYCTEAEPGIYAKYVNSFNRDDTVANIA